VIDNDKTRGQYTGSRVLFKCCPPAIKLVLHFLSHLLFVKCREMSNNVSHLLHETCPQLSKLIRTLKEAQNFFTHYALDLRAIKI